jgi:hypothetical protein
MIRELVACEHEYINTDHPDFIGGTRAVKVGGRCLGSHGHACLACESGFRRAYAGTFVGGGEPDSQCGTSKPSISKPQLQPYTPCTQTTQTAFGANVQSRYVGFDGKQIWCGFWDQA